MATVKPLVRKKPIALDPHRQSPQTQYFQTELSKMIIGQERAVKKMAEQYQVYLAGMNNPTRPIATMLFLGPTGSGKTRAVEAASEVIFGTKDAVLRIDCAEFAHSHEIAKLIGSPPGFLGHRATSPILTQDQLDWHHTDEHKITFLLLDEIEKASDALWSLLLGIMDKATLTLGDNRRVDFSKTMLIMTSNLGVREISSMLNGGIGFVSGQNSTHEAAVVDQKIYQQAHEAAKRKFSPEFMNRIDKVVVFRSLQEQHLSEILNIELDELQKRVLRASHGRFIFACTDAAKDFLIAEGFEQKYGARHIKRSIERFLTEPLANLMASEQINRGDFITIDLNADANQLEFRKQAGKTIMWESIDSCDDVRTMEAAAGPQTYQTGIPYLGSNTR